MESMVSHNKIGQAIMHIICILLCVACISSAADHFIADRGGDAGAERLFVPAGKLEPGVLPVYRKEGSDDLPRLRDHRARHSDRYVRQSSDDDHVRVSALEERASGTLSVIVFRVLHDAL